MSDVSYMYASVLLEFFALMVTVLLMISSFLTQDEHDRRSRIFAAMLTANALALVCDMITWLFEGPQHTALMYAANFFVFSLGYVVTALFTAYLSSYITKPRRADRYVVKGIYLGSGAAMALVALSLFNGMYFYVQNGKLMAGDWGWLSVALSLIMIFCDMGLMLCHRAEFGKKDTAVFLSYGIFPVIALIIQMAGTEITVTWLASTLTMLLIYLMIHVEYVRRADRQRVALAKNSAELAESRLALSRSQTSLVLSQIQPHFLYNSLTVIDQLVKTDPALAHKALADFSVYLRGNLGSLKQNGLIPFSEELRHIRAYLSLEQMRFGELLAVEYDIQASDFLLPALCVQPLVENAVNHGLGDKPEGGTVTITARERENCYEVTVTDDGVGFEAGETRGSGEHIGISNVRTRLDVLCGGQLKITSQKGVGTTAAITIDKERAQ